MPRSGTTRAKTHGKVPEISNAPVLRYDGLALCIIAMVSNRSSARDNGQFANSPLKQRIDQLASGKGLCCSFADGVSMSDVDSRDGYYRVRLHGEWVDVPDAAVSRSPTASRPVAARTGRQNSDPLLYAESRDLIPIPSRRADKPDSTASAFLCLRQNPMVKPSKSQETSTASPQNVQKT
jgi:hypothetical protein